MFLTCHMYIVCSVQRSCQTLCSGVPPPVMSQETGTHQKGKKPQKLKITQAAEIQQVNGTEIERMNQGNQRSPSEGYCTAHRQSVGNALK